MGSVSSRKRNLKVLSDLTGTSVTKSSQTFFLQEQSFASLGSFSFFFLFSFLYFSVTSAACYYVVEKIYKKLIFFIF